ncbi:hypothetical protein LSH36_512g01007 [Paralvinella palmiformis]|uniref:Cadherin domain-containing protein n=1 Tax=Paralvinella palmiformis TaxID=53620 RepID=A0AAD9J9G6_9ANNE|nr:hypothetical protein LSH36_512g01007 [Paralvinella palmiformis]
MPPIFIEAATILGLPYHMRIKTLFTIHEESEVFCTADLRTWLTSMGTICRFSISVIDNMHFESGTLTVHIQETIDRPVITNLPNLQEIFEDLNAGSEIFHVSGGIITVSSSANFNYSLQSPSPSFTITVGIRDDLQTGEAQNLTLDLKWVNRKPSFDPDRYLVAIPEECDGACTGGTPYRWQIPGLTLSITDRDVDNPGPGVNDSLTCGILPSFGSDYFTYQNAPAPYSCNKLYQDKRIDIDDIPENRQINLTVWVKDRQGVSNNDKGDTAHIYITVTDINDNWPVFINVPTGSPPYRDTIPENTPGGVSLFTVTATDKDSGLFGEVTYSLENNDTLVTPPPVIDATLHFEVDRRSGVVQTKQYLDYEAINPKYVYFNIRATDGGGLSTIMSANVTITNVNDVRPVWQCNSDALRDFNDQYVVGAPCFYNEELRSDILVDYEVLTISSTDVESPASTVTYHLLQPSRYFNLNQTTGMITVDDELKTYVKYILYCYSQDNTGSSKLMSQPHLRIRLDTFDPKRQLINIIMKITEDHFNKTQQEIFQKNLRYLLKPWFPKIERTQFDKDRTTVSIYALKDNSTFDEINIDKAKQFVDRDDLLYKLRQDIQGTPSEELTSSPFVPFDVIQVEPTYPIWLTDTIPGIITLCIICLAIVALILGLILGLCSRYEKCCFEKKKEISERNWENKANYDRLSINSFAGNDRPKPRERRGSVDTVHSLIYDPR